MSAIAREPSRETVYATLPVANIESAYSHLSAPLAGNSKEEAPV